jgi:hypothetical protein
MRDEPCEAYRAGSTLLTVLSTVRNRIMAITKETFTGETYLKDQLEILRKYIYNVAQRHKEEFREQRMLGIPNVINTMGNLVEEIIKKRGLECDIMNAKFDGGKA